MLKGAWMGIETVDRWGVPSRLLERGHRADSSKSCHVWARGVALSDQSLAGATLVVNGGGDIGLLLAWTFPEVNQRALRHTQIYYRVWT